MRYAIVLALLALLASLAAATLAADAQAASHPKLSKKCVRLAARDVPRAAARWAPLVNRYWSRWLWKYKHRRLKTWELRKALWVIWRECRGNPRCVNPASGCAGLFQLIPGHWHGRFDPFSPKTNISLAGMLYVRRGWAPWRATAW